SNPPLNKGLQPLVNRSAGVIPPLAAEALPPYGAATNTWLLTGFFDELSVEYRDSTAQVGGDSTAMSGTSQTASDPYGKAVPATLGLSISPNPFNPTTAISFQLSAISHVNLSVYDISGRKVVTLIDGFRDAGYHQVTLDGSILASGVYLYRMKVSSGLKNPTYMTGKMVLMK
ncbi:MAG: T9SS type A sorting domain-containing protein, partial [bacterium]